MMKFDRFNHDEIQNIYSIQSITTSVSLDCKPEKSSRSIFIHQNDVTDKKKWV